MIKVLLFNFFCNFPSVFHTFPFFLLALVLCLWGLVWGTLITASESDANLRLCSWSSTSRAIFLHADHLNLFMLPSKWVMMNEVTRRLERVTDDVRDELSHYCPQTVRYLTWILFFFLHGLVFVERKYRVVSKTSFISSLLYLFFICCMSTLLEDNYC